MIINMPDPHPGRCQNLRPSRDAYGYPNMVRCLDYEGKSHVCSFPKPPPQFRSISGNNMYTTTKKPEPWVKPEDGVEIDGC